VKDEAEPKKDEFNKPWRGEYDRRAKMVKDLKYKVLKGKGTFSLVIEADDELIDQLIVQPLTTGDDAIHLIVTNYIIKSAQLSYRGRVKEIPYPLMPGQKRLVIDG